MHRSGCGEASGLLESRQWGSDQSPPGQFGCKSRQVRSTLPAQGAIAGHSHDSGATSPAFRVKSADGEKLNCESPVKG